MQLVKKDTEKLATPISAQIFNRLTVADLIEGSGGSGYTLNRVDRRSQICLFGDRRVSADGILYHALALA